MRLLENLNKINLFSKRHLGSGESDITHMLNEIGYDSMSAFIDSVVPDLSLKETKLKSVSRKLRKKFLKNLRSLLQKIKW